MSLPGTLHTAFQNAHCTRPAAAFASTNSNSSVTIVEEIDANRLTRSHPMARPTMVRPDRDRLKGSGVPGASVTEVMAQRSTSAIRALYQFMNRLMPRLMVRNTSMMIAIASMAWPVWFSVVFAIDTMSW